MIRSDTTYRARLIAARDALGLSPREMAERLLTPRQTYMQWESGRRRTPGASVVAAEMMAARVDSAFGVRTRRRQAMIDALSGNETAAACARRLGVPVTAVYNWRHRLRAEGILAPVIRARSVGSKKAEGPRTTRNERNERNEYILSRLRAGATLTTVAQETALSKERVRQIADRAGLPSRRYLVRERAQQMMRTREARRESRLAEQARLITAMTERVTAGESISHAGLALGLTRSQIMTIAKKANLGAITQHGRWRRITPKATR